MSSRFFEVLFQEVRFSQVVPDVSKSTWLPAIKWHRLYYQKVSQSHGSLVFLSLQVGYVPLPSKNESRFKLGCSNLRIVTKSMVIIGGKGHNLTNYCCDCDLFYFLVYEVTKLNSLRIAFCKICRERIGSRTGGHEGFKCALSLDAGSLDCLLQLPFKGSQLRQGMWFRWSRRLFCCCPSCQLQTVRSSLAQVIKAFGYVYSAIARVRTPIRRTWYSTNNLRQRGLGIFCMTEAVIRNSNHILDSKKPGNLNRRGFCAAIQVPNMHLGPHSRNRLRLKNFNWQSREAPALRRIAMLCFSPDVS